MNDKKLTTKNKGAIKELLHIIFFKRSTVKEAEDDVAAREWKTASQSANWSDLPIDLLRLIYEKLTGCDNDLLRCSAVCVSWRSLYDQDFKPPILLPPFLLLSGTRNICSHHKRILLLNTRTDKAFELLQPKRRWFYGSRLSSSGSASHGWIFTTDKVNIPNKIHIYNPFTRGQIKLPSRINPGGEVMNICLTMIASTSPMDPNCVVLATYSHGEKLALCRPRDKMWTNIKGYTSYYYMDTIFYKGEFYAVDTVGDIFRIDCNRNVAVKLPLSRRINISSMGYFVEFSGDLLLVVKRWPRRLVRSEFVFEVYRFHWGKKRWIEVTNVGNYAILLGGGNSRSFVVSGTGDWKPNCIYLIGDRNLIKDKIAVYHMVTKSLEWLDVSNSIVPNI